jgi:hypothetical protein
MLVKLSKLFKEFKMMAFDWVVACAQPARGLHGFNVTGGGTATDAVLFSTYGLPNMATADYQVLVNGEIAGAKVSVSAATKAITGFSVIGLGNNEVGNVLVYGRFAGMPTA